MIARVQRKADTAPPGYRNKCRSHAVPRPGQASLPRSAPPAMGRLPRPALGPYLGKAPTGTLLTAPGTVKCNTAHQNRQNSVKRTFPPHRPPQNSDSLSFRGEEG